MLSRFGFEGLSGHSIARSSATFAALSSSCLLSLCFLCRFSNCRNTFHVVNVVIGRDQMVWDGGIGEPSPGSPCVSGAFPSPPFRRFWLTLFHSDRYCIAIVAALNRSQSQLVFQLSLRRACPFRERLWVLDADALFSKLLGESPCEHVQICWIIQFRPARCTKRSNVATYSSMWSLAIDSTFSLSRAFSCSA